MPKKHLGLSRSSRSCGRLRFYRARAKAWPRAFTSSPDHLGRMDTASCSTASCETNCSMARSSTALRKPRRSSRNGVSTITPDDHTQPSVTGRPHHSPSRRHHQPSTGRRSCNNLSLRLVQNIDQATQLIDARCRTEPAIIVLRHEHYGHTVMHRIDQWVCFSNDHWFRHDGPQFIGFEPETRRATRL